MQLETDFQKGVAFGVTLVGTCDSGGDELGDCSIEFAEGVDSVAGLCDECGWWVEPHELNDDRQCEDCASYAE